jgi:hypothetical protein
MNETKSEQARRAALARSPESRSAGGRKAWQTRLANLRRNLDRAQQEQAPHPPGLKPMLTRFWFWLTHDRVCFWCHTRYHRAWLPWRAHRLDGHVLLERVTSGICPKCAAELKEDENGR